MIVDAHCDVLWKLLKNPNLDFYKKDSHLHINYPNMVIGGIGIQVFAIFVSPTMKYSNFKIAMQSIDDFYEKVYNQDKLVIATTYQSIVEGLNSGKRIALLSLEGAESIEGDLSKLRLFYRLGVRAMGLTWNFANQVADGVGEERDAGLTNFGVEVVQEMNRLGMIIDVSHLSQRGFWDVIKLSNTPIIASHSNAKAICNHPRNLSDNQIKAIIDSGGMIGLTFVRDFTKKGNEARIEDLLPHIDHIAALGGISNIGLGSDFDGATPLIGLENASKLPNLVDILSKRYNNKQIEGFLGDNWLNFYKKVL